ncbi:conjugal transfer protein TrbF [Kordiimonas sp.]|uniref:conjugal transfer protein TrbF n=1 Tax=Kordiimonas sp. TaxID=1970157 RepID=UPI003A9001A9
MFKRHSLSYGKTPVPVTPYQKAAQAWDMRLGTARAQARNWRLMALGLLTLVGLFAAALVWQSLQSHITPYVVEVDKAGSVRTVGPAVEAYNPTDAQIAYHLAGFITRVRSLSVDPLIVRQNWLEAYDYATDRGAQALSDYAREVDPFARVGERSITVEITSVVRASPRSFQIKWTEKHYEHGSLARSEAWTGILTTILQIPKTDQQLRKNPLGIYVHALSWSRDITPAGDLP